MLERYRETGQEKKSGRREFYYSGWKALGVGRIMGFHFSHFLPPRRTTLRSIVKLYQDRHRRTMAKIRVDRFVRCVDPMTRAPRPNHIAARGGLDASAVALPGAGPRHLYNP